MSAIWLVLYRSLVPRSLIERGLKVTNWGCSVSRTVAECALLLTLSALRRSSYWAVAMHREGQWKDKYAVVTGKPVRTKDRLPWVWVHRAGVSAPAEAFRRFHFGLFARRAG